MHISKPHIVDLLRTFDKHKWIRPRIRYASVRSKPELIADLKRHFVVLRNGDILLFQPKHVSRWSSIPTIEYDLSQKQYRLNGGYVNVPQQSRTPPVFSISHEPVTLDFSEYFVHSRASEKIEDPSVPQSPPSRRRASVSSEESLELGTRSPSDGLVQTEPSSPSEYIPT